MRMTVVSSKTAETRNSPIRARNWKKPKAYVALMERGAGETIARRFVERSPSGSSQETCFSIDAKLGDIYEIRRWWWDAARGTFLGGTVWIGIGPEGGVPLTREEAIAHVSSGRIEGGAPEPGRPVRILPKRMLPPGIHFGSERTKGPT